MSQVIYNKAIDINYKNENALEFIRVIKTNLQLHIQDNKYLLFLFFNPKGPGMTLPKLKLNIAAFSNMIKFFPLSNHQIFEHNARPAYLKNTDDHVS